VALSQPVFPNALSATITGAGAASGATSIPVVSITNWPQAATSDALTTSQYIPCQVLDTSSSPPIIKEYIYVTAVATGSPPTLTVTRQAEEASRYPASALAAGLVIVPVITKGALADLSRATVGSGYDANGAVHNGTAYADPDTAGSAGPAATVIVPASGIVRVTVSAYMWGETSPLISYMSWVASGSNTIAADDSTAAINDSFEANKGTVSERTRVITGLTPGSTTFTCKYKTTQIRSHFTWRQIVVEPLS
jgi:hypothetical protein